METWEQRRQRSEEILDQENLVAGLDMEQLVGEPERFLLVERNAVTGTAWAATRPSLAEVGEAHDLSDNALFQVAFAVDLDEAKRWMPRRLTSFAAAPATPGQRRAAVEAMRQVLGRAEWDGSADTFAALTDAAHRRGVRFADEESDLAAPAHLELDLGPYAGTAVAAGVAGDLYGERLLSFATWGQTRPGEVDVESLLASRPRFALAAIDVTSGAIRLSGHESVDAAAESVDSAGSTFAALDLCDLTEGTVHGALTTTLWEGVADVTGEAAAAILEFLTALFRLDSEEWPSASDILDDLVQRFAALGAPVPGNG